MKIIIAGYGVEGRSNYQYIRRRFPDAEVIIADERPVPDVPDGVAVRTGERVFAEQCGDADMVMRTASLSPRNIVTNGKIWSATNEFFAHCPAPIIGVTGTKGKGTTCSFITEILRAAGKTVHLVGNIGVPALDVLERVQPDDVVVYELSSFQLWDLERSPHIAVVLMIEPDHLDVHADMADYVMAKANICRTQQPGDVCVYHPHNALSTEVAQASAGQHIRYAAPDDGGVYVRDGAFYAAEARLCDTEHVRIPGAHNLENACAAITAVRAFCEVTPEQIAAGLQAFDGLPHRLKFVANKQGVAFYDDSIATTPGSTIAALRAFPEPKVLILGGSYKGADFTPLMSEMVQHDIRHVVLIGEERWRLADLLQALPQPPAFTVLDAGVTMTDIVAAAALQAHGGDTVILSPACASFGMFKNYTDRGEQFVRAVQQLNG